MKSIYLQCCKPTDVMVWAFDVRHGSQQKVSHPGKRRQALCSLIISRVDNVFATGYKSFVWRNVLKQIVRFSFIHLLFKLGFVSLLPLDFSLCLWKTEYCEITYFILFKMFFFYFLCFFSQSRLSHDYLLWESTVNLLFFFKNHWELLPHTLLLDNHSAS